MTPGQERLVEFMCFMLRGVVVAGLVALAAVLASCSPKPGIVPAAPTGLTITAATRAQISIEWTGSSSTDVASYRLERSPVGAGTFGSLAGELGPASLSAIDATVDAYTAYTYRVRAISASGDASEPSNEDTAGPTPAGLAVAAIAPTDQGTVWAYGTHTSLVLDENDDPMIAYMGEFSGTASGDTDRLYFLSWDRTNYVWRAPKMLGELGQTETNQPNRDISLARDRSTGRLGIVSQLIGSPGGASHIALFLSEDGGATWTREFVEIEAADNWGTQGPLVALSNGKIHIAYYHECIKAHVNGYICSSPKDSQALVYLYRAGPTGAFQSQLSPTVAGTQDALTVADLALDGSGEPALAYFTRAPFGTPSPQSYNRTLAFWRPGQAPARITDSNNVQDDAVSVSLAFDGLKPRVLTHLDRDQPASADLWFVSSPDGLSWGSPVALPRDGRDGTDWNQSLAIGSKGQATATAYHFFGDGSVAIESTAGGPKVFRSSDLQTWVVASPDATALPKGKAAGAYIDSVYAGNDKLYATFQYGDQTNPLLGPGLILWREP